MPCVMQCVGAGRSRLSTVRPSEGPASVPVPISPGHAPACSRNRAASKSPAIRHVGPIARTRRDRGVGPEGAIRPFTADSQPGRRDARDHVVGDRTTQSGLRMHSQKGTLVKRLTTRLGAALVATLSVATAAFVNGPATPAHAVEVAHETGSPTYLPVPSSKSLGAVDVDVDVDEVIAELRANGVAESVGPEGEIVFTLTEPQSGLTFTMSFEQPQPTSDSSGLSPTSGPPTLSPRVSGGTLPGGGFYIDFTRGEQQIIATFGGQPLVQPSV